MEQFNYTIYGIENLNSGHWYIGQTGNYVRRKAQHLTQLKKGIHINPQLQAAYDKHGSKVFHWHILAQSQTLNETLALEIQYIETYNSFYDGYNQTTGGRNREDSYRPCEWNGIQYASIDEAAHATGVSRETMGVRIWKGYTCDADMRPGKGQKPVVWNGVEYSSVRTAAEDNGYRGSDMSRYITKGHTCDEDIDEKRSDPKPRVWNGITYPSMIAASKAAGIAKSTLKRYMDRGYVCDADVPLKNPKDKACVWEGIEYLSIADATRATGISYRSLVGYLRKGYTKQSDVQPRGGQRK